MQVIDKELPSRKMTATYLCWFASSGRHDDGIRMFHEALDLAREVDDSNAIRHILRGLGRATKAAQTDSGREEAEQPVT